MVTDGDTDLDETKEKPMVATVYLTIDSKIPVSYTHLEEKSILRQLVEAGTSIASMGYEGAEDVNCLLYTSPVEVADEKVFFRVVAAAFSVPVSYTHLDVYKRQPPHDPGTP